MIYFLLLISTCILIFLSDIVKTGTYNGLLLWFNTLIPSILPSMLLSSIIINENIDEKINRFTYKILHHILPIKPICYFSILFGILSGIPTAAAISFDLYKKNAINETELKYMLIHTSTPGINFIISYIYSYILQKQISLRLMQGLYYSGL